MSKRKRHLQHPGFAPPTAEWNLTSAVCGFACSAEDLAADKADVTCKRCLKNKPCETLPMARETR